jgi:hypothetical protein
MMYASPRMLATVALWPLLSIGLFALLSPRRAALAVILGGWLLLPNAVLPLPGLPDLSKPLAVALGALVGMLCFDGQRLLRWRPSWIDAPIVLLCAVPAVSSLSNQLGWYDALTASFEQAWRIGIPYVVGRIYCSDLPGVHDLAAALVLSAVLYAPLCMIEMMYGPILNHAVYAGPAADLLNTYRFGGFRPEVFLRHGLELAVWMAAATVVAVWLASAGARRRLAALPLWLWSALLGLMTVLMRSVNGWALALLGIATLVSLRTTRRATLFVCLMLAAPVYVGTRIATDWDAKSLVRVVRQATTVGRAQSLQYRLQQERSLMRKAWQRPGFGWGRWGRARIHNAGGEDVSVTDSAWIIAFGDSGLLGVVALFTALLLPPLAFLARWPAFLWTAPAAAPAAALAVVLVLVTIDCCFNAFVSPPHLVIAGSLAGLGRQAPRAQAYEIAAIRRLAM